PPKTTSERSCCCIVSCTGQRQRTSSRKSWSGRWTALDTWPRSSPTPDDATTRNCWRSSIRTRSTSTTPSTASSETNRTPLYDRHVALGGRMVDFGGWEMPQQYTSIRDEHLAVRKVAGLFDVSHMGRFQLGGDGVPGFIQGLVTNDVSQLGHGQAQYNLRLNDDGGILDHGKDAGVLPAGLGARDAARLEAALRLWGNDMDESVNPYEAGLGWTVKLDKGDFTGREALQKVKAEGPHRQLVGLKMQPGDIARHGARVSAAGKGLGAITSGTHSFFLGYPIALAMVEARSLSVGDRAVVEVRGREAPAEVVKLPFYRGSAHSHSEKKES